MVKGLNEIGLRTVMDVVYNHTNASGQNPRATLDRLVPGYYHRRDDNTGNVFKDSCCDDTAAEFAMMEKLMVDTGVTWVRDYKVSGFRFDIMTFHPLASMQKFQDAVEAVNPSVYIYGEGWNFGAVQDDKRFTTSRQANLAHGHRQLQRPHPRPGARRRPVRQRREPRAEPGLHLRLVLRAERREQR